MYFGFKNISIKYGKRDILSNVTIAFEKGSISTIIGKNGCGKSSLLRTITKKVSYKGDGIIYKDKNIFEYKKKMMATKIAYLPQIHESPADIDVKTLVSYGRYPYTRFAKKLSDDDNKMIDFAIEAAGLGHLEDKLVSTLSGGERQRAWIAMSICQNPEILILDEPTTYLDISYQVEVLELVKKLNKEYGMTIIMVLHDLNLAARYSDYLYALADHGVYNYGRPKDVINEINLEKVFSIKAKILRDEENGCPFFIPSRLERG